MKPVMPYHGGKFRLASWIRRFFPEHRTYVEPFGGAAGVLLQKAKSESEVYNDIDDEIVNVFRILQCRETSLELKKKLQVTPYARSEFELSHRDSDDDIERARRTLIRAHMGFSSSGLTDRSGFRIDSARDYGTAAHSWAAYPGVIEHFCKRLRGVIIENRVAAKVILNHDRVDTLFFVDPPYVHATRIMGKNRNDYKHEMTDDEHIDLLQTLKSVKGMVVLSGYDNAIYSDLLTDWRQHKMTSRISANRGAGTRTESVWLNPVCAKNQLQAELFDNARA